MNVNDLCWPRHEDVFRWRPAPLSTYDWANGEERFLGICLARMRHLFIAVDDTPFVVANRMAACSADLQPERPETGTDERHFMAGSGRLNPPP